ncbi:MAG TPA: hypothetical protein VKD25_07925 [Burkholderiales bacterium]|nr:hypothetical protein [Burkholderiales bacterium]
MRRCLVLATVLALASTWSAGAETAATVLSQVITRDEIAAAEGERAQDIKLYELVWRRVSRHYIDVQGLAATSAEIAEAVEYHREFAARDRVQRARKLVELNERLAADGLKPDERAHLEEFRKVLTRLAQHDADQDQLPPLDPAQQGQLLIPWIEQWKMNKALHEQYGGIVAITRFGPDPHGARAALMRDYERRGLVRFTDAAQRERVFAWLNRRPSMVTRPEEVDFTPYWKRPIPPSYFPD